MTWDGDNDNYEYYVLIQTRLGQRIVKPNSFGQASAIALGLLTCQCNGFLQTSRPGSIEPMINELATVSIFKPTMDHMDLISRNSYDGSINLSNRRIIAAETSHKDNPYLGKAMKSDDCEDFMKVMKKEIKYLTTEDVWEIIPKSFLPTSAHIIRLIWSFKIKINSFEELIKHKARLCVHGGMIDFHNKFEPVVNWSTLSLTMTMVDMDGWESRQLYYFLALSQAEIDSDVYLHLPENWFDMLKTGLEDECFKKTRQIHVFL